MPSSIRALDPRWNVVGRAYTVRCSAGDNLALHWAIAGAGVGDVLVATVEGEPDLGYWGELMTSSASARGLAGLVIAASVRDIARLLELGWPVFCTGRGIRATSKDPSGVGGTGSPLSVAGILVATGDLVRGDGDGVVVVPRAKIAATLAAAEARLASESELLRHLARGRSTLDVLGLPPPLAGDV